VGFSVDSSGTVLPATIFTETRTKWWGECTEVLNFNTTITNEVQPLDSHPLLPPNIYASAQQLSDTTDLTGTITGEFTDTTNGTKLYEERLELGYQTLILSRIDSWLERTETLAPGASSSQVVKTNLGTCLNVFTGWGLPNSAAPFAANQFEIEVVGGVAALQRTILYYDGEQRVLICARADVNGAVELNRTTRPALSGSGGAAQPADPGGFATAPAIGTTVLEFYVGGVLRHTEPLHTGPAQVFLDAERAIPSCARLNTEEWKQYYAAGSAPLDRFGAMNIVNSDTSFAEEISPGVFVANGGFYFLTEPYTTINRETVTATGATQDVPCPGSGTGWRTFPDNAELITSIHRHRRIVNSRLGYTLSPPRSLWPLWADTSYGSVQAAYWGLSWTVDASQHTDWAKDPITGTAVVSLELDLTSTPLGEKRNLLFAVGKAGVQRLQDIVPDLPENARLWRENRASAIVSI
jgi:hypothetical protein